MLKLTAKRTQWFEFPQDPSGETKVEILHLKPGDIADIDAQANRIVGKQIDDDFKTEVDFNYSARSKALVKRCIINWEGFLNEKGKPMKCTDNNKLKVLREFDWFLEQIGVFRTELAETVAKDEEDAEKN